MTDARLDWLALCIFLLALATVTAPLVSVDPAIPIGGVAALMGAALLDQVTWQGRGVEVLMGWTRSPAQRQRLVQHEAGHLLVACVLDIPVTDYVLDPWQAWRRGYPGYGGVRLDDQALWTGSVSRSTIDHFCVMWMAGAAAELMHFETAIGAASDRARLRRLCQLVGFDPDYQERWARLRAQVILSEHADAYAIAVEQMSRGRACKDCIAAVKAALGEVNA